MKLLDKHNNSAKMLAEKKGEKEVAAMLEEHALKAAEKRKTARETRTSRTTTSSSVQEAAADPALTS